MRLFVSIQPPAEVLNYIETIISNLSGLNRRVPIKWSARNTLHITVLFIGNISEDAVTKIGNILDNITKIFPPFYIELTAIDLIKHKQYPKVIMLKAHDQSGTLKKIHDNLFEALGGYLEKKNNKEFKPHITLGRIKAKINKKSVCLNESFEKAVFKAEKIYLVNSRLTPIGPIYSTVTSKNLLHGKKNIQPI